MKINLRSYQNDAVSNVFNSWNDGNKSVVGRLFTGGGKTLIFADVIQKSKKRAIVLCHRRELIWQAREKIERVTGFKFQVEMGEYKAANNFEPDFFNPTNSGDAGIVASVQTLTTGGDGMGRITKWLPTDFDVLIGDEFHHFTSPQFRRVMDYFKQNPNLKILGVTATPNRADEESLSQVADDVAFDRDMNYGIREGWLVPIEAQAVHVESLDFKNIKLTAGDLNQGQLSAVMESEKPLYGIADSIIEIAGDKRGIGFSPSVNHAKMMADIFNRHRPGCAAHINGKTDKDERKKINSDFANGTIRWIWNCGTHCLDSETEILTRSGWVSWREINYSHKVANWDNKKIFFKEPKFIIKRERYADEKIVVLETKNKSIRVTEKHRMLFKKQAGKDFEIIHAGKIVGERGFLPVSGMAKPEHFKMPKIKKSSNSLSKRISSNAFALRRRTGISKPDSERIALNRIIEFDSMRYTNPPKLTLDDCKFIGFWIGDGSRIKLKTGGLEYTVVQSAKDNKICEEIRRIIKSCGFDSKETNPRGNAIVWRMCRGTGFGSQKRNGVFRIEPYLEKSGSDLFWSLNESQFDSLIEGFWMADGEHYDNPKPTVGNLRISQTNKKLLDLLQAIACCRGYRASITCERRFKKNHSNIYRLSVTKKDSHEMTKFRMSFETGWKKEVIWCVTSDTGNIITRRRGTVTVTGNTEGFDDAGVEVIVPKPTKSVSLLEQMVGRGTRPADSIAHKLGDISNPGFRRSMIQRSNKSNCLILEYYGNRYDLATTFDLFAGNVTEDAVKEAIAIARKSGSRMSVTKSLDEEEKRAEERKKKELEEAARKAKIVVKSTFKSSSFNPFDVLGITAAKPRGWDVKKQPSPKMQGVLRKMGLNPDDFDYAQTRQIVKEQINRWHNDLCTFKQLKKLKEFGIDAKKFTFAQAQEGFEYLGRVGFRRSGNEGFRPRGMASKIKMPVRNTETISMEQPF